MMKFKVGDSVYVPNQHLYGSVESIHDNGNTLEVTTHDGDYYFVDARCVRADKDTVESYILDAIVWGCIILVVIILASLP